MSTADTPSRAGRFGRALGGILGVSITKGESPPSDGTGEKVKLQVSSAPRTAPAPAPVQPASATVDTAMFEEVRKGIEERAPSQALTVFLETLADPELVRDVPEEGARYRMALKTTARIVGQDRDIVGREIASVLAQRASAVVQERQTGESELKDAEAAQLSSTNARLTEIGEEVERLRTAITRLQEEETTLTVGRATVQRETVGGLEKLNGACAKWSTDLGAVSGKVRLHLVPAPIVTSTTKEG